MKKTFLARRNALLTSSRVSWGGIALVGALLFLALRLVAPDTFLTIMSPALRAGDDLAFKSHLWFSSFSEREAIARQNEYLKEQNQFLIAENRALATQIEDIQGLAKQEGSIAGVIARPPTSPYDIIVVGAGSASGITVGMRAYSVTVGGAPTAAIPLGTVSSVSEKFSRITLFSAPGVVTESLVGENRLPLTVVGAGGGAFRAEASRAAGIVVNDLVFTNGPGNLPLGRVVRIDSDPAAPVVDIKIMPVLNPFSLSLVLLRESGVDE